MSKIFLVIILSIQLLTVTAFYPESYDVDIYTAIKRSLYLRNIPEDSCQLKMCRSDLWCLESGEPIKQYHELKMSNDKEMKLICVYCFNPEKTFKPKPGVTQYKNVIRFNQVGPGCYRPKDQLKEVPNGCKCPK
ncbi:uncharacterized protein LOC135133427 [Zophobas morio]